MKKQLPGWAVLLIITLVAGLALGGTNALTKGPIEEQTRIKAENARKSALPNAESFEEQALPEGAGVDWVYAGLKDGAPIGYVAQKTVNGFGGKVEVIAGVDTKTTPGSYIIGGITVGGSDFAETAGLGARAKEPEFTNQFTGKAAPVSFIKAGGEATESTVDALTSATITTTAVVNGVNDIVKYIKSEVIGEAGVEMPAKPAEGVFSASEKGFRGPVYVEAAFDGAGKVTYLSVGDESFAEDIGAGVAEPDFMIQFIGKQMPLTLADIDAIAGATISSTAVVKALNTAYAVAGGAEIVVPETPTLPEKPAEGVFSAAEQGFGGPVYVEAAFDGEDKISYISVGDDQFAETEGFGARAKEAENQAAFIGLPMPLTVENVDALAGATITKTAIVNGLNKAFKASKGEVEEEPAVEEPAAEIVLPEKPAEGVVSAAEQGFGGPVYVEAAFDGDGKITYISVGNDAFAETPGFGARALEAENLLPFIGLQMPLTVENVDALAGATITKTAIVTALNKAFEASQGGKEDAPAVEEPTQEKAPENAEDGSIGIIGGADGPTAILVTGSGNALGEAISFFTRYQAAAEFEGDKLSSFVILTSPVNGAADAAALELPALSEALSGRTMPLNAAEIAVEGLAAYQTEAIVIALNQAYENSLAGQQ